MLKVILVCNFGMSSSILSKKMNDLSKERNLGVSVEAIPNCYLNEHLNEFDVCLIGPQLVYAFDNIKKILQIPCKVIDNKTYALADALNAINLAKELDERR